MTGESDRASLALVGGIMVHGAAALAVGAGDVNPDHIKSMQVRGLYRFLLSRYERGESLEYVEVSMSPEVWGGPLAQDTLHQALDAAPITADFIPGLVRSVTLAGVRRDLEAAIADSASESNLDDYVARVVHLADAARDAMPRTERANIWDEAAGHICELAEGKVKPNGIPTGFSQLDTLLGGGGLLPGQLTVLGARPGVGKSSLARQIALNAARLGRGAAIFSLEDGPFTYACRVVSDGTDIPVGRLRNGNVNREELSRVIGICHEMKESPIELTCIPSLSSSRIANMVRLRKRVAPCDLVVVDYVNLIRDTGKERRDQIDNALRTFVELARLQNVAVLLCAQLNRNSVIEDRRPSSHDLKESGGLEQEGKAIILVHRARGSEDATVILEKNNQGDVGDIPMRFDTSTTSFRELSREPIDEGSEEF